jgi:hypothetical protein
MDESTDESNQLLLISKDESSCSIQFLAKQQRSDSKEFGKRLGSVMAVIRYDWELSCVYVCTATAGPFSAYLHRAVLQQDDDNSPSFHFSPCMETN